MNRARILASWMACALAVGSGGCAYMPTTGPAIGEINQSQQTPDPERLPYALVRVTPQVIDILATSAPRIGSAFTDRRPAKEIKLGPGDVLNVTIFEAAAGGLFVPIEAGVRPGNFVVLPNQIVDSQGNIQVPYAGSVRAAGRSAREVQTSIVDALKSRAIEPQAIVTIITQNTSMISVLGQVNAPTRVPASIAGERVLDAITRAGGPKVDGHDTWVMIEREGRRATAPFGALVYEPRNNIWVHPNDTIYLYREPQTFLAFGAAGRQGQYTFDAWRVSLGEAVGKAGGLNNDLAEPAAVFLYRGETREVAERLGVDCSRFPGPIIPIIYNLNLRNADGYALATKFELRNKDVLYIANATTVELTKAMEFFRLTVATVDDPINAAISAYSLRTLIRTDGLVNPTIRVDRRVQN